MEEYSIPELGITYRREGESDVFIAVSMDQDDFIEKNGRIYLSTNWHYLNATSKEEAIAAFIFFKDVLQSVISLSEIMKELKESYQRDYQIWRENNDEANSITPGV